MKILFVSPFFPPWAPGGAEHSLEQMCNQFSRNKWEVEILAAAFDDRNLNEQRSDYWIRWIHAPYHHRPGQNIDAEYYLRSNDFYQSMMNRFSTLEKPDVIIANNAQVYKIVNDLAKRYKIPSIGIVRDTQLLCEFGACMDNLSAKEASPCCGYLGAISCSIKFQRVRGEIGWRPILGWGWQGVKMHIRRSLSRSYLLKFNHIVTISDALNILIKKALFDVREDKISTIRNFSTKVENISDDYVIKFLKQHNLISKKYFLFAGRKTYGKGVDLLVDAMADVHKKRPEFKCIFLGRGRIKGNEESGCLDIGSVPQELLLGLLKQSVGLVIPGRWQEGLNRTMIDAIGMGVPVICTQAGAPPIDGVMHPDNGIVCICNDTVSLKNAMNEIIDWTSEKKNLCKDIDKKIFQKRFSDETIIYNWNNLLKSLIS